MRYKFLSRHHLKALLKPQGDTIFRKEYLLGFFILSMAEEVSFKIYGFDVKLYRDSKNPSIINFEISKEDWSASQILDFFKGKVGELNPVGDAFEFRFNEDWIRIHKLMLLIKSYFIGDVKIEDWISLEPEKVKIYFMKPKMIGLPKVLKGIIGFDHGYEMFLGHPISLEEAKEVFMSLFKYPIMKEGLKAFMKLSGELKTSNL